MRTLFLFALAVAPLTASPIAPAATEQSKRPPSEALCGPEIVLLGDAWEHARLERDALIGLTESGNLELVPQKTSALFSHLMFMQNQAVMVFGERRETLLKTIHRINDSVPHWNSLALADRRAGLAGEWPALTRDLDNIAAQFPEEALISSSEASFVLPPVVPSLQVHFDPAPSLEAGKTSEIRFRLTGPGGLPVQPDFLHTTHTQKLHALLLDPSFSDYQHEHPQPTGNPGEYAFPFTPRLPGPYRMWLDVMPVATGRGEFPIADLMPIPRPIARASAPPSAVTEARVDGFRAKLELPSGGLTFGNAGVVSITLEEPDGKPLSRIEPLMGAFAHVVGIADDLQTILHIHPLGAMPVPGQTGGPKVEFQLRPLLPGWLRLYSQFQVDGRVRLVTFIVPVTVK